jgi:hypothetical protein
MKIVRLSIVLLLFYSGCEGTDHSATVTPQTEKMRDTSESGAVVHLRVSHAVAVVNKKNELTLFATLVFRTDEKDPVMVYPFGWGAYVLSSPDREITRIPPANSPYASITVMLNETSRLDGLAVPIRQVPVAIDYRIPPAENWIYRIANPIENLGEPIRFRIRYSFENVQSNEVEFSVRVEHDVDISR